MTKPFPNLHLDAQPPSDPPTANNTTMMAVFRVVVSASLPVVRAAAVACSVNNSREVRMCEYTRYNRTEQPDKEHADGVALSFTCVPVCLCACVPGFVGRFCSR
jgi:hypothetical protein